MAKTRTVTSPAISDSWVYGSNNANARTNTTMNGDTAETRTYDRWGRLSTRTVGSYSATYGYRFGDKLKSVTSTIPGESASVAYNYDGLGKRRNKVVNGGPAMTWWRWGLGWETLAQYNDSDNDWDIEGFAQFNVVKDFMHPLAEAAVPTGQSPANATYSYLALDHLSNARAVFNQTKVQTASMEFYPYGQRLSTSGTLPYNQFTAKPYDTEDGLYYFPYRYYSPGMDRWTSADPLGTVDGPNVYAYVGGGPIINADPKGLFIPPIEIPSTKLGRSATACLKALAELGLATKDVLGRVADIFKDGADPFDDGHQKALRQAKGRMDKAVGEVKKKCGKFMDGCSGFADDIAAALAGAAVAARVAAPFLFVMV